MNKVLLGNVDLDFQSLYRHAICFGGSGSGKTAFFLMPLLHAAFSTAGTESQAKAGALIIDVKGDMAGRCRDLLRRLDREEDLLVIGRNGNAWFPGLRSRNQDPRGLSEWVMELSELVRPSHDDLYWTGNARRLLFCACIFAKAAGCGRVESFAAIDKAISSIQRIRDRDDREEESRGSDRKTRLLLRQLESDHVDGFIDASELASLRTYLVEEIPNIPFRTWAVIANYAKTYLAPFLDGKLAALLSPDDGLAEYLPELILDHGKVVVVSLSATFFGPAARVFRDLVKTEFQRAVLQRHELQHFDGEKARPVNRERPVFLVCDEFSESLTAGGQGLGDPFFLSEAREFRCGCLLATQGVSALLASTNRPAAIGHVLNNCATKLFLATDCPQTLALLEQAMAVPTIAAKSPGPIFRLPGQASNQSPIPLDVTLSEVTRLPVGEGVLISPGRSLERIRLTPLPSEAKS